MVRPDRLPYPSCAPLLINTCYEVKVHLEHRRWPTVTATVVDAKATRPDPPSSPCYDYGTEEGEHLEVVLEVPNGGTALACSGGTTHPDSSKEAWIRRHRDRSPVEVRIDPANYQHAELVDMGSLPGLRYSKFNLTRLYLAGIAFAAMSAALPKSAKKQSTAASATRGARGFAKSAAVASRGARCVSHREAGRS